MKRIASRAKESTQEDLQDSILTEQRGKRGH